MTTICVFCASGATIDRSYRELATAVGARIAADGLALVSGGGKVSMMGDVARAARAGGAHTTGVIPNRLVELEMADTDADELIMVDTMRERKRCMDEAADAFLVLPGGIGTFEELFEVWTSRTLEMHDKPVVVLDPDGYFDPLWAYVETLRDKGFVRQWALDLLVRTTTLDDAFAALTRQT